ncbi:MAG: 16S rRNA (guanine(966)-N(2))-methyltransferase RsmD [Desulfobacterales bacterium]|nr:16S rRNA (guanine(966)-N(2))-methyltransferase RsmD [Desulfobacterales bacterium]
MRIIGGSLRGRRLFSPKDRSVRPTADRLRETIFNILAGEVKGAAVLDLFAGTGALGIEALSREAASAWFVDRSRGALALLGKNLKTCRLEDISRTICWDIRRNLACLRGADPAFSLVFIDPPYARDLTCRTLEHLHRSRSAAAGACIVVEHSATESIRLDAGVFRIEDQRRQGNTLVSFIRYLV